METFGMVALVGGSIVVVFGSMLRKFGVGMPGGKPDCGCNSGSKCKKVTKR